MSQLPAPALPSPTGSPAPVRAAAMLTDAPDILFVLRHYRWLIILGTLLGFLVGTAAFLICRRFLPAYTAAAQLQVMPSQQADLTHTDAITHADTPEEVLRFIRRQVIKIRSDQVLDKVLVTDAFQKDPHDTTGRLQSKWLRTNNVSPKSVLRRELDIGQERESDVFHIAMSGGNREELAALVEAVAQTYYAELRNEELTDEAKHLDDIKEARQKLQESITQAETALADFRAVHDISEITNAYTILQTTLGTLNADLIKAESDAAGARSQFEVTRKEVESNSLELNAEQEQIIEGDPSVRYLEQNKLNLQQDRAVNIQNYGPQHRSTLAIDARIQEVTKQSNEVREKLRVAARQRMQENAKNIVDSSIAHVEDLTRRRDEKDRTLKDLDRWLVEYRTKSRSLDDQRELLKQLNQQVTLLNLQSSRSDISRVRFLAHAVAPDPTDMTFPKFAIFGPGGFVLGLAASFGIAYLLERTNTRVRTPRDITKTMQMPLLGFVPDQQDDMFIVGDLATSIRTAPGSMIAESFRQIRGRLAAQVDGSPLSTLLVASASPGGGATTVASNLAIGLALNDLRVLLVDANFYRPGLKNAYKNLPAVGFSDLLADRSLLAEAIVPSADLASLHLLGPGTKPATTASELLESKGFRELLGLLKAQYDVVVFDGAPLNLVSDSLSLASKVDGVIAVVRAGVISRGTVTRVRDQLKQVHATLLGLVLNAAQTHGAGYFKENYKSFYQYASLGEGAPAAEKTAEVIVR